MDLQGKKVLVFGAGISGIGSCGLLEKEGAEVILYDGNDKKDAEAMKAQLGEGSKVRVVLGAFPEEEMESLDLVVMSPGVPTDLPVVLAMKEKGIPVWGEIELAYVCGKGDVLGITGTNGKTTTTSLLGEIMKNARDSVFCCGKYRYTIYECRSRYQRRFCDRGRALKLPAGEYSYLPSKGKRSS